MSNMEKKKTVSKSLKAPVKLACRPAGNNSSQPYRSVFMRDRDRVLYSKAFRRLAGKTQVYLSGTDDHKRTRLTHTLEVAQIAKTIAQNLKLDLDLTEAIALGHDIGHTPFGHAGEQILHELMTPRTNQSDSIFNSPFNDIHETTVYDEYLGFKHNLHSVNVALNLEPSLDGNGLNLTNFTLYGMCTHSSLKYRRGVNPEKLGFYKKFDKYMMMKDSSHKAWSFEAFIVAEADEIAQRHHDLEDAIRGNLISRNDVSKQIEQSFSSYFTTPDRRTLQEMNRTQDNEKFISLMARLVVNLLVNRIIKISIYNMNSFIEKYNLTEKSFVQYMLEHDEKEAKELIAYDKLGTEKTFQNHMDEFEKFLTLRVLSSYDIQTADCHGQYVIKKIFQAYYKTPTQLPDHCVIEFLKSKLNPYSNNEIQDIMEQNGIGKLRSDFVDLINAGLSKEDRMVLMRVICNQIAGMTDTYAQKTYHQLYL